jgi:DNA mismatch repair endonuclease MutH
VVLVPKALGFVYASEADLLRHAAGLTDHTAREVAAAVGQDAFNDSPAAVGKTGVGHLVEYYLGRKPNNSPEPDIAELGVEVKALPIKPRGQSFKVKEPTSLSMIDYAVLDVEPWADASVQHKLSRILWVPYHHSKTDKRDATFRRPFIWSPDAVDRPIFEEDYEGVREFVRLGLAHEISESNSFVLSARRKGAKGQMADQPHSPLKAKSRAWALKVAYTDQILTKFVLKAPTTSLAASLAEIHTLADVMPYVETKLGQYEGRTLSSLAAEHGATVVGGKAGPAGFVRKLLGVEGRGQIEEFAKLGIRVQSISINSKTGTLREAVSFPAMSLREFAEEEWEESDLRELVDHILFIPLLSDEREDRAQRLLGRPFFWQPNAKQWDGIEAEWRMFQQEIRDGKAAYTGEKGKRESGLTPASRTRCIHVRPHGLTSNDTDIDPRGNVITKQSFWLNKEFVASLVPNR